jgi:hypothetical protein
MEWTRSSCDFERRCCIDFSLCFRWFIAVYWYLLCSVATLSTLSTLPLPLPTPTPHDISISAKPTPYYNSISTYTVSSLVLIWFWFVDDCLSTLNNISNASVDIASHRITTYLDNQPALSCVWCVVYCVSNSETAATTTHSIFTFYCSLCWSWFVDFYMLVLTWLDLVILGVDRAGSPDCYFALVWFIDARCSIVLELELFRRLIRFDRWLLLCFERNVLDEMVIIVWCPNVGVLLVGMSLAFKFMALWLWIVTVSVDT